MTTRKVTSAKVAFFIIKDRRVASLVIEKFCVKNFSFIKESFVCAALIQFTTLELDSLVGYSHIHAWKLKFLSGNNESKEFLV